MPAQRALSRWVPAIGWMAVIFLLSTDLFSGAHTSTVFLPFLRWLFPRASPERIDFIHLCIRKSAHLQEYAILGVLLWRAAPQDHESPAGWGRILTSFAIAACYAATDEFHQTFVPARTAAFHDVLIDSVGASIGIVIMAWLSTRDTRPGIPCAAAE